MTAAGLVEPASECDTWYKDLFAIYSLSESWTECVLNHDGFNVERY